MFLFSKALICALLVISTLQSVKARKYFRHRSYPRYGGRSGSHSYPSSGGLSDGGHKYPSAGSHARLPSGENHTYQPSGGSHAYPNTASHEYSLSGNLSGNSRPTSSDGHPSSSSGLASNTPSNYPSNTHSSGSTTDVHYHYHYSPPKYISYTPRSGGPPQYFPVYQGMLPTYVNQYKDSGSKYGTLLAGLALFNLGTLAVAPSAISYRYSNYKPQPGEVCKFAVRRDNGDYEITEIDCQLIISFILQEEVMIKPSALNTINTTTTATNVTTINTTNPASPPKPQLTLPINQMLPVNATVAGMNITTPVIKASSTATNNDEMKTYVTVNTTSTVVHALDVKGKSVEVTPGLKCYVIRETLINNIRKAVDCGLLQTYADRSLRRDFTLSDYILMKTIFSRFFYYHSILRVL